MESSTAMEGAEVGSEIAARFERATRSGLASSSLASFSYSPASLTVDQPPTLADLLPHLGPPDASRCPACKACLPFGPRSRICLACSAQLVQSSPPSFTSTLAFRRFSDALGIEGLETDSGEAEEGFCSDPELDVTTKFSSVSLSLPLEVGGRKNLSHADVPLDQGKPIKEPEIVKFDVQTPLPSSADLGSLTPAKPMDLTNVEEEKRASILDYSAKLEGISLDDFFSNQVKSQAPAPATNSDLLSNKNSVSKETSGINFRKDTLFWDPLSDSIIPDGFDLITDTSETSTNKVAVDNVVVGEDDDPFSSWEGDFQSAAPATTDVSAAASSHFHGPQQSIDPIMSRNIDDVFGDISNMSGGEIVGTQGNNSWVTGDDLFGLKTDVETTFSADSRQSMDVDDFFGSGWQQSVPLPLVSSSNESQSSSLVMQSTLLNTGLKEDLLGIGSPKKMEASIINHSSDSVGELTSTENSSMKQLASASDSGDRKNKIVGSLLAQLHDLSFLLVDKLVMKAEGK